jgi:exodeoxyribonuclease-3
MKIATWNVNSVKAHLPNVLDWLKHARPDVVLLQEIKCVDEAFPELEIGDAGYNVAVHGQKTYNGVAILAKRPIEDVERGLPGADDDAQARYIEATVSGVRIASVYAPNGNPWPGEKFDYKLAWFDRLAKRTRRLLKAEETFVLGGDFNVCPTDDDVYDPESWANDALCRPECRAKFRTLLNLGLTEAFRALHPHEKHRYSFWDYQGRAWERDNGLRIDHLLLSPQAADRLKRCDIDKAPRGKAKASDHVPVWCELGE